MIKYFLEKPALESIDLKFERKSDGASGYDLMANIGMPRVIAPGKRWFCSTGLYLEMPCGVEAQVRTRSGLARDHGVIVLNAPGTVDSDYRGEVMATLINLGDVAVTINPGDRVAQLVFMHVAGLDMSQAEITLRKLASSKEPTRVEKREMLGDTARGASGHGSTGGNPVLAVEVRKTEEVAP